jgi:D-aspartate ligase
MALKQQCGTTKTAFVLSLFDTGLGVIRSLGRAGIPVIGLDFDLNNPGFASRYCRALQCPHPVHEPLELLRFLLDEGARLDEPGILFPASDAFVLFVSRYRNELARYFRFNLAPPEVLEALLDKRRQYDLAESIGTPYATTYYPETAADVRRIAACLDYPAFIKPYYGHLWREHFSDSKGFKVHTSDELIARFEEIWPTGLQAMVQSIILGPNTNHFKVCAYIDRAGEPLGVFTLRKIRQYPTEFGVGTMVESVTYPELVERGLGFLCGIGYRGIGSIEFKRDDRDGRLKMIELNPRVWQQNIHATDCGINFPLLQYRDLTGAAPAAQLRFTKGLRWIDAVPDFQAFWSYYRAGAATPWGWARSWLAVRSFATFAPDDLRPFLRANRYGVKYLRAPLYAARRRR